MHEHPRHHALLRLRRRRQTISGPWRITGSSSTMTSISITPASERICHFYVPIEPLVSH